MAKKETGDDVKVEVAVVKGKKEERNKPTTTELKVVLNFVDQAVKSSNRPKLRGRWH